MTDSPATPKKPPPRRVMRLKKCVVCGDGFETDLPNKKTCSDICRDELAAKRAEERKAKGLPASGRGRPAVVDKLVERAKALDEKTKDGRTTLDRAIALLEKERPDLALTRQFGITHLRGTDKTKNEILSALEALNESGEVPSLEAAAVLAGGRASSVVSIESWMRADPEFGKAVRARLAAYVLQLDKSAHRLTVEGLDEPVVSMGNVIATKKIFDGKLLAARLKQFSPDFRKHNSSAGGGVNVQVNLHNQTGMQVGQDERPHATIYLDEAWRLSEMEREQLASIYAKVLQIREGMESAPKLDWHPSEDIKAELQAEDISYTEVESADDEI